MKGLRKLRSRGSDIVFLIFECFLKPFNVGKHSVLLKNCDMNKIIGFSFILDISSLNSTSQFSFINSNSNLYCFSLHRDTFKATSLPVVGYEGLVLKLK